MKIQLAADSVRYAQMTADELRRNFLVESLFTPGKVELAYSDADRAVIGGATPAGQPLSLATDPELRAEYFLQRREIGILNVGGNGAVTVDGATHEMERLDCLYVGRGVRDVRFASADPSKPAKFYLLSYPAHAPFPTTLVKKSKAQPNHLGSEATCNKRTIYKCIHAEGARSCQLVMGFTELAVGSVWNTMPPHTHLRRSEVYLYFDLSPDARVVHLMGRPDETRHLFIANEQAVISPSWSIHSGAGTARYTFCWGMGGENQEFADMDPAPLTELR